MALNLGTSTCVQVMDQYNRISLSKKISNYVFKFEDKIGEGNFSKVYKGYHQMTNQIVAIKIVQLSSVKSPKLQELLFSEIQVIQSMDHPNILRCYEVFKSNNNCYIITEFCNAGDLQSKLKKQRCFSEKGAIPYINDINEGLFYLGQRGIVHRDLKIANIFIHNGVAKIADFGFAKYTNNQNFKDMDIGSPLYMSPEGMIEHVYGMKTDIWSFGIIIYELLHGKTPFCHCKTQKQLKTCVTQGNIPMNPNLSYEVRNLISICLTLNFKNRPDAIQLHENSYMQSLLRQMPQKPQQSVSGSNLNSLQQNPHKKMMTSSHWGPSLQSNNNCNLQLPLAHSPSSTHQNFKKPSSKISKSVHGYNNYHQNNSYNKGVQVSSAMQTQNFDAKSAKQGVTGSGWFGSHGQLQCQQQQMKQHPSQPQQFNNNNNLPSNKQPFPTQNPQLQPQFSQQHVSTNQQYVVVVEQDPRVDKQRFSLDPPSRLKVHKSDPVHLGQGQSGEAQQISPQRGSYDSQNQQKQRQQTQKSQLLAPPKRAFVHPSSLRLEQRYMIQPSGSQNNFYQPSSPMLKQPMSAYSVNIGRSHNKGDQGDRNNETGLFYSSSNNNLAQAAFSSNDHIKVSFKDEDQPKQKIQKKFSSTKLMNSDKIESMSSSSWRPQHITGAAKKFPKAQSNDNINSFLTVKGGKSQDYCLDDGHFSKMDRQSENSNDGYQSDFNTSSGNMFKVIPNRKYLSPDKPGMGGSGKKFGQMIKKDRMHQTSGNFKDENGQKLKPAYHGERIKSKSNNMYEPTSSETNKNYILNMIRKSSGQEKQNSKYYVSSNTLKPNLLLNNLQFREGVGMLHYCRLIYRLILSVRKIQKLISSNDSSEKSFAPQLFEFLLQTEQEQILSRYLITSLNELLSHIRNKNILFDPNQTSKKRQIKEAKLKEVSEEYFRKYDIDINNKKGQQGRTTFSKPIYPIHDASTSLTFMKQFFQDFHENIESKRLSFAQYKEVKNPILQKEIINLCYYCIRVVEANQVLQKSISTRKYKEIADLVIENWLAKENYSEETYLKLLAEHQKFRCSKAIRSSDTNDDEADRNCQF